MVSLLWTKSKLPASKAIRWLTKERVSHFAFVLDNKIVFHSNFVGANLNWFKAFSKSAETVYRIDLDWLSKDQEDSIYNELYRKFDGDGWDFGAALYLIFWRITHPGPLTLPTRNLWSSSRHALCIELAEVLKVIGVTLPSLDTLLPERLYFEVKPQLEVMKNGYIPAP